MEEITKIFQIKFKNNFKHSILCVIGRAYFVNIIKDFMYKNLARAEQFPVLISKCNLMSI